METGDSDLYVFGTSSGQGVQLDDSQLVTLKLDSGHSLRFQPDAGAQCNVIPVHLYKKASTDFKLEKVQRVKSTLVAYGGFRLPVLGKVRLPVMRGDFRCLLDCQLVESTDMRPLLGHKACVGMGIIQYLDNDALNQQTPDDGARVFAVDGQQQPLTPAALARRFPAVFSEKTGLLEGEYHIRLDTSVQPMQHPPRRIPVALRAQVRQKL